jgi:hypothetical protein
VEDFFNGQRAMERFPPIRSPGESNCEFSLDPESVQDLFYDGNPNPDQEISKLQLFLNLSSSRVILKKIYGSKPMNRNKFCGFVTNSCESIDRNVANEIFSCAVNNFADDGDELEELPDQDMTKSQFTTAFVRLANLWSLMNEGMADSSKLTKQTSQFLKHLSLS